MIWLNPFALFALVVTAAPILIHILIQRRAERFPFPTLRFLQPTRLASIRRHLLDDLPLLAVRIAVLGAAVTALAGPLIVTAARKAAWDRRIVRAVVVDAADAAERTAMTTSPAEQAPWQSVRFETATLGDGIRRAVSWLETTPPARREIVIASRLPIGALTDADLAAIPPDVGVRFERSGTLPAARTVADGHVLAADGLHAREVTLAGDRTSVRESAAAAPVAWPIEVAASDTDRRTVDAAVTAVLSQRVWAGSPDRRARLVLVDPPADLKVRTTSGVAGTAEVVPAFRPAVTPIAQPWMAAAAVRIARDPDLATASARVAAGLSDARFTTPPWQALTVAADGRPLVAAAAAGDPVDRLMVATAIPAADIAMPLLLRSIANGLAGVPDLQPAEVVPIPDAQLQRWSRTAQPLTPPRIDTVERDDRRWFWLAAALLLALEMWMRRARPAQAMSGAPPQERARVA